MNPVDSFQARLLRRHLASDKPLIGVDMRSSSRTMLIAFGGLNSRMGMPPFEFMKLTSGVEAKRLFVRDRQQAWYHRGLPGYGASIGEVAERLEAELRRRRTERLVVTGNSAGGYAALLFGTLLGADVVLSFAPQTVLDLPTLEQMDDHRWDDRLVPLAESGRLDPEWIDLRDALPKARRTDTRYEVFVDRTVMPDRLHAERVAHLDGLRTYWFGGGGHWLVRDLRNAGALSRVITRALEGSAQSVR